GTVRGGLGDRWCSEPVARGNRQVARCSGRRVKGTLVGTLPSTAPRTRPEVAPDTDTAVKGVQPHGRPSTCAVGTEQEERTELPSGGRVRGGSGPAYGPGRGDLLPGALQPLHPGCGRIHRHHRPDARTGGPPAGLGRLRADAA